MLQPKPDTTALAQMPTLYFERTTPEERRRHAEKLAQVDADGGLLIEAVPTARASRPASYDASLWPNCTRAPKPASIAK